MNELPDNWEQMITDDYKPIEDKIEELYERNYNLVMQLNSLRDNILNRLGLKEGQELIKKAIGEA